MDEMLGASKVGTSAPTMVDLPLLLSPNTCGKSITISRFHPQPMTLL
jgi:hypothetical protein